MTGALHLTEGDVDASVDKWAAPSVSAPVVNYSVLEELGVGIDDSVQEANEKRSLEYERQLQLSLDYVATGYDAEWASRPFFGAESWVQKNRLEYQKSFDVKQPGETQLAVSIPIDRALRELFVEARREITDALCSSAGCTLEAAADMSSPVWVPEFSGIPVRDLHITVCIPSLWRRLETDLQKRLAYNEAVGDAMARASAGHEGFVVEVDRLCLGKDGSLLAVFRTVGPQADADLKASSKLSYDGPEAVADGTGLYDRASAVRDPMTALRADIIGVFFERGLAHCQRSSPEEEEHMAQRLLHQATIVKTVGGSTHGYIHCSLARLAVSPGHTHARVDLAEVQRVVRLWSARLGGRRMWVRGFKLSEMTGVGLGGNKNPFDGAIWERDILLGPPPPLPEPLPKPYSAREDIAARRVAAARCATQR
mmetsp:Transcript_58269/g.163291  ORF Transcript_58269/g.163291 Transcript_58269/m.163291 type:complete len:425 (+) Transcript_58269:99-1373(+)